MRNNNIGTAPWSDIDLTKELKEFFKLYKNKPVGNNDGGMMSTHLFAVWCVLKKLNPKTIIESGIWRGQGTWFLEQICPNAKIFSFDIDLSLRYYISDKVTYFEQDMFESGQLENIDKDALVFFDDHQNAYDRLKLAKELGFKYFMNEDNYPVGQGNCFSLKQAFEEEEKKAWLNSNLSCYHEFPPLVKTQKTRWGDQWSKYPTPDPILNSADQIPELTDTIKKEAKSYTWICYGKVNNNG